MPRRALHGIGGPPLLVLHLEHVAKAPAGQLQPVALKVFLGEHGEVAAQVPLHFPSRGAALLLPASSFLTSDAGKSTLVVKTSPFSVAEGGEGEVCALLLRAADLSVKCCKI